MPTDDILVVGRIGSPYGVKGWLNMQSFTTPVDNLFTYSPWYLRLGKQGAWQDLELLQSRPHKKAYAVQFAGINDRDAAAELTGGLVGVRRSALPASDAEDGYYWLDLVGCTVVDADGRTVGRVTSLLETGVHDVLVIKPENDAEDVLIPFVEQYVGAVDMSARKISVMWEQGW